MVPTFRFYHFPVVWIFCKDRLKSASLADPEMAQRWIDWAHKQADLLDPLQDNLAQITSLDVQLESWFSGSQYGQVEKCWWSE